MHQDLRHAAEGAAKRADAAEQEARELREEADVMNEALRVRSSERCAEGTRCRASSNEHAAAWRPARRPAAGHAVLAGIVVKWGSAAGTLSACMHAQAAAERIRAASEDAEAAKAVAEARGEEAASLRRQTAELEGRLSVAEDAQVGACSGRMLHLRCSLLGKRQPRLAAGCGSMLVHVLCMQLGAPEDAKPVTALQGLMLPGWSCGLYWRTLEQGT